MNHTFEIEIKSLLGGKEKADELLAKMKIKDPNLKIIGSHKQLNHYFIEGSLASLYENVGDLLKDDEKNKLKDLSEKAKDFSVRTRDADGKIILVVKASVDDTTSSNGTARLEFEVILFPSPGVGEGLKERSIDSIDKLDKLILSSGFSYQAKWSRERSEYIYNPYSPSPGVGEGLKERSISVSIDKNAGYGYLAEFEKVIEDESKASEVKEEIRKMMAELEVAELAQDRLERMFKFYNDNWNDYYGTEKIFNIE